MTGGNEQRNRVTRGAVLVFLSGICWAPVAVLGKICVEAGVDVVILNVIRLVMGVAFLSVVALVRYRSGRRLPLSAKALSFFFGASVFALGGSLFFLALRYIDASLAFVVIYSYPAAVVIVSAVLGWEKITLKKSLAVMMTFAGVTLVLRIAYGIAGSLLIGVSLTLCTMLIYSIYVVICDKYLVNHSSTLVSFYSILGGAVAMLAVLLFTGIRLEAIEQAPHLLLLVAVTAIGSALSLIFFLLGIRQIGASWAAIISSVQPVLVMLLAWVVLGEVMVWSQLVGIAMLISGVAFVKWEKAPLAEPGP